MSSQESSAEQSKPTKTKKQNEVFQPLDMSTKMKGLLKGLRYISHIFENNEKEQEMQIGHPTDVKHVAHIGWEGPQVHSPTWIDGFKPQPDFSAGHVSSTGDDNKSSNRVVKKSNNNDSSFQDLHGTGGGSDGLADTPSLLDSPSRDQSVSKQTRHHQSTSRTSISSPSQDGKKGSSRPGRSQNSNSLDLTSQELTGDIKKSRRKKPKETSGGLSKQSKTKAASPFSDLGSGTVSSGTEEGDDGNHGILERDY